MNFSFFRRPGRTENFFIHFTISPLDQNHSSSEESSLMMKAKSQTINFNNFYDESKGLSREIKSV